MPHIMKCTVNVFEYMPPPSGLSRIMQTNSQMCVVYCCSVEAITGTLIMMLYLCGFLVFQKKKLQGDAETLYSFPTRQGEICLSEN